MAAKKTPQALTRFERMSDEMDKSNELVHPANAGFREKVTPKAMDDKIFVFECPDPCGGSHFRHAGYMKIILPFLRPNGEKNVAIDNHSVMVCVACRKSFIWVSDQMYDVTDKVDLKAWEKFEKEAHAAVGPGGNC